jgi:hypothetical protein
MPEQYDEEAIIRFLEGHNITDDSHECYKEGCEQQVGPMYACCPQHRGWSDPESDPVKDIQNFIKRDTVHDWQPNDC